MTVEEAICAYLIHVVEDKRLWANSTPMPSPRSDTMHIVRRRMWGERGWAAFRCEDVKGRRMFGTVEIRRSARERWDVSNDGWGVEPKWRGFREPSVNLAGAWGPDGCWGGGHVHGAAVHRVRLVDADGASDEDLVENGVTLLFIEGAYRNPCLVELYDADGTLLATEPHAPPDWTGP